MDWLGLAGRTIFMYIIIFVVYKIMGKREIGQLSVLDLVVSIMIAEIAVIEIEEPDGNLLHGIVPIIMLLIIQVLTAFISLKNRKLRLFLDGKPSIIVANGEIIRDEMKKQKYNLDDLLLQLREEGVTSIDDVEFAILENTGKLSVIKKEKEISSNSDEQHNQVESKGKTQPKIIPPGFRYEMLPIPLIMDGKVQDENLEKISQTRFWLKNIIQAYDAQHFKDVLLCTIDHKERIFVDVLKKGRK